MAIGSQVQKSSNEALAAPAARDAERTPLRQLPDVPRFMAAPWADSIRNSNIDHTRDIPWAESLSDSSTSRSFRHLHCTLVEPRLRAVYSMQWWDGLLAAAGKDGWCSLFHVPAVCLPFCQQVLPRRSAVLYSSARRRDLAYLSVVALGFSDRTRQC
jgi:hypothetical protein